MAALVKGMKMEDKVFLYALEKKTALIEKLKKLVSCPSVGADPKMFQGMESARKCIENWSILLDIKLIFKTFGVVFSGSGAY